MRWHRRGSGNKIRNNVILTDYWHFDLKISLPRAVWASPFTPDGAANSALQFPSFYPCDRNVVHNLGGDFYDEAIDRSVPHCFCSKGEFSRLFELEKDVLWFRIQVFLEVEMVTFTSAN
jgi:hypothetical protein